MPSPARAHQIAISSKRPAPRNIITSPTFTTMNTGTPIPGASPEAGDRLCFVDGEVEAATGHPIAYPIWFRGERLETEAEPEAEIEAAPAPLAEADGQDPTDAEARRRKAVGERLRLARQKARMKRQLAKEQPDVEIP